MGHSAYRKRLLLRSSPICLGLWLSLSEGLIPLSRDNPAAGAHRQGTIQGESAALTLAVSPKLALILPGAECNFASNTPKSLNLGTREYAQQERLGVDRPAASV